MPVVRQDTAPAATPAARTALAPVVTAAGGAAAPAGIYATSGVYPAAAAGAGAAPAATLYATAAVSRYDPAGSSIDLQLIADSAYGVAAVFPPRRCRQRSPPPPRQPVRHHQRPSPP